MFANLMPHWSAHAHTPIFRYTIRRVRWGGTVDALARYTRRVTLIVFGALALLWLLVILLTLPAVAGCSSSSAYYRCDYILYEAGATILSIYALVSILADVLLDFACIIAALNSLRGRVNSPVWDLLRLTTMHPQSIVGAEHAVVQARAWRSMIWVVGMRFSVIALALIHAFALPIMLGDGGGWTGLVDTIADQPIQSLLTIAGFIVFLGIYVIEPLWRMWAMTALGLALTAWHRSIVTTILSAMGWMLGLWILQIIIMAAMLWVAFTTASGLLWCLPLFASIGAGFVIYGFFYAVRVEGLNRAMARAFRD
jgi:hypothetical protein